MDQPWLWIRGLESPHFVYEWLIPVCSLPLYKGTAFIGQTAGYYRPGERAGLIGATIGAVGILFVWNRLATSGVIPDHGA